MVRRTHGACVTSVLCARVLVCKAQSSERGRGSGEAKPGARHASLCAITQSRLSAMRAYKQVLFFYVALALFAQSVCPASALLRAAPCCSPLRCESPLRHGAQAIIGIRKRQEAAKKNGIKSSFSTLGRQWRRSHAPSFFLRA